MPETTPLTVRDQFAMAIDAGDFELDYEIHQNGEWQAGSSTIPDAQHYAAVYGQDGPVECKTAVTLTITLDGFLTDDQVRAMMAQRALGGQADD
jgi:hypothetical protein